MRSWIEPARAHIYLSISILLHVLFYILFTVSCRLRCVCARWNRAGLQTCNESDEKERRHFWDNRRMHKYTFLYSHRSWSNVERIRTHPPPSIAIHRHPTPSIAIHRHPHNHTPNVRRLRLLFNEPKRMNAFATNFYRNEQNKIEINVFLCYVLGS